MEIPVRWSHQGDGKVRVDRAVLASLLDLARVCRRLRRVGYGASEPKTGSLRDRRSLAVNEPRRRGSASSFEEFPLPPRNGGVTIPFPLAPIHTYV